MSYLVDNALRVPIGVWLLVVACWSSIVFCWIAAVHATSRGPAGRHVPGTLLPTGPPRLLDGPGVPTVRDRDHPRSRTTPCPDCSAPVWPGNAAPIGQGGTPHRCNRRAT